MTEDMDLIVKHALAKKKYDKICLVGFSLGGSITANYLGEKGNNLPREIHRAVTISTPFNLRYASYYFHSKLFNKIYIFKFLRSLKRKIRENKKTLELLGIDKIGLNKIKDFNTFEEMITAPIHGFKNKNEYYQKTCPKLRLPMIEIPTLIISAQNDPFLGPLCFPVEEVKHNPNLYLHMPKEGGHCGFTSFDYPPHYWSEITALEFILENT
jgi:predicted alpha/beta-fold hydrolase